MANETLEDSLREFLRKKLAAGRSVSRQEIIKWGEGKNLSPDRAVALVEKSKYPSGAVWVGKLRFYQGERFRSRPWERIEITEVL
jgi:hypothetical protein